MRIRDAALVAAAVLSPPLHRRPLPARQGDRPRRRGGVAAADGDRLVARSSSTRRTAASCSSRSSSPRWRRSPARCASRSSARSPRRRRSATRSPRAGRRRRRRSSGSRTRRAASTSCAWRPSAPSARATSSASRRSATASCPTLERELAERERGPENPMVKEEVDEDDIAAVVARWTGIPVDRLLEGETEKLIHMEERLHQRVVGQDEAVVGGRERAAPRAHRAAGSRPADRLVRLPRPDRRRQDGARARARRVHVRRRARDGAARHERVPGAAHGVAARRRAARLRRLRRGRPADRGGAAAAVLGRAARRDREGAHRGVRRAAAGARRRAPDRRPGPHGRLPQHGADHDVEHPQRRVDARALPAGVPEPDRRDRRVQGADARAARRDRRAAARRGCARGSPSAA